MGRLVYRGKEEFLGILLTILNDGGGGALRRIMEV